MFDQPITTIQQAKAYFQAMACSGFHMAREFPERYKEYQQLHIPKQMELEWRTEQFNKYYARLMAGTDKEPLWWLHSSMCDLFAGAYTNEILMQILEVTHHIRDSVPVNERIMVAETINGRTVREVRGGLIYSAYDLGNLPATKAFIELSLHFSAGDGGLIKDRCQAAADLCRAIQLELGLEAV